MNKLKRKSLTKFKKRKRVRGKIFGTSNKPRVSVYRSLNYLYLQAIDDVNSATLFSCSTLSSKKANDSETIKNIDTAHTLGLVMGKKLHDLGVDKIIFDRNSYLYHGKVKGLADGIREAGIIF